MPILQAEHLYKKFQNFVAVNDVSLDLAQGEILGVLGPNGAGKTTTIQMLLGILTPTSGKVTYFGKSLSTHREEILEHINFSSTYTSLPGWLTVQENLTWLAHLYKIENRKKRIKQVVEIFRLEESFTKLMVDLSSGQLTRVNLAKALLNSPRILLLDEPTASLDIEVAKHIREFLLEQQEKFHTSIIITSHNMSEVEELCDRVIVINHGKIIANDTPDALMKSITLSHLELVINNQQHMQKTIVYCERGKILYTKNGKFITSDIAHNKIPYFLRELMDAGIEYNEIIIKPPSLEDYFLQVIERVDDEIL